MMSSTSNDDGGDSGAALPAVKDGDKPTTTTPITTTATISLDNNNDVDGHSDDDQALVSSEEKHPCPCIRPSSTTATPKWCLKIRSCTGVMVVLGIVNTLGILLMAGVGYVLEVMLENSNSSYEYYDFDIMLYCIFQLCICLINLGTLYYLCKRFNSSGRDYKAAMAVFCCSSSSFCCGRCRCRCHHQQKQRKVYPEAVRPICEVIREIWNSTTIFHLTCWKIKFVGWMIFGSLLFEIMHRPQDEMLYFCLVVSSVLWIAIGRFLFSRWDDLENDLSLQPQTQMQKQTTQGSSSSSSVDKDGGIDNISKSCCEIEMQVV